MREEVGVGGRVRARRAADRRLVDVDHLVEHLDALDVLVLARLDAHLVEPVRERLVDDLVHERRLAGARDAGDGDELPDRELDVDALEVVLGGAADGEDAAVVLAPRRDRDRAPAREEVAGDRALRAHHLLRGAFGDDLAAVLAGARPHVDDPVGDAHHLLVVLDDEHRVAERLEPLQRRRSAGRCRAGGARSTARRGCRGRRRAASRSASRAGAAAPRRPTASSRRGRAGGSRRRRRRGT